MTRLQNNELLLMDGGTGSELQRRGIGIARGVTPGGDIGPWSARALGESPDTVSAVHEDYLKAGADIIITNTFWSNPTRLSMDGIGDRWKDYNKIAGELAVRARDSINPEAYVAAGIAPPHNDYPGTFKELRGQAEVLAQTGVDVILPEYVGSLNDCQQVIDACSEIGLPVFLGVKHVNERLKDPVALVKALEGRRVDAILAMCTLPDKTSKRLPELRKAFEGVIGAYANIGYETSEEVTGDPNQQMREINWGENSPEKYAAYGKEWIGMGAQIIGGCCATGPEHIASLRPVVKGLSN